MSNFSKPVPTCCDYARVYIEAVFNFTEEDYDNSNAFKEVKPKWEVRGTNIPINVSTTKWREMYAVDRHIKYCPSCGVELPDFELKDNIHNGKFATMDYNGEYCGTCGERSMCCNCIHPIKMWKVKGG